MMPRGRKQSQRGMTLLELVVASALMLIVLATASMLMVFGASSYQLNARMLQSNQDARAALLSITQDIHTLPDPLGQVAIDGAALLILGSDGIERYRYTLTFPNGGSIGKLVVASSSGDVVLANRVEGFVPTIFSTRTDADGNPTDFYCSIDLITPDFSISTTIKLALVRVPYE